MNKKKLSDIAIITMGQSPESSFYNTAGLGMPFLQGSKTFGKIYPTFPSFTEKITKIALKGDILMSVRAPVGDINIAPVDMCIGRGLCSIRMKNGNQKYLYYLLKNNIHNILSKQNGTVFASINRKDLEDLEFSILEEREQKSSGDFLALFDEKIKVNDEINDNLSLCPYRPSTASSPFKSFGNNASRTRARRLFSRAFLAISCINGPTVISNDSILPFDGKGTSMLKSSCWFKPGCAALAQERV